MMRTTAGHLRGKMQVSNERINGLRGKLESLSPRDTLLRGYAIVHKETAVVTSPSQVSDGDMIGVTVAEGEFKARVTGDQARLLHLDDGRDRGNHHLQDRRVWTCSKTDRIGGRGICKKNRSPTTNSRNSRSSRPWSSSKRRSAPWRRENSPSRRPPRSSSGVCASPTIAADLLSKAELKITQIQTAYGESPEPADAAESDVFLTQDRKALHTSQKDLSFRAQRGI